MIIFKDGVTPRQFTELDVRLKRIVWTMEQMAKWAFMDDLVVTSISRNDASTHSSTNGPPWRFIDIAILNNGGMNGTERVRKAINELFPYGVRGYQTIPELRHGTAPHAHLQIKLMQGGKNEKSLDQ